MKDRINSQQSDWLAQTEELNDTEASRINGGASDGGMSELTARANALYSQMMEANISFQQKTAGEKVAKDQSGKVQG